MKAFIIFEIPNIHKNFESSIKNIQKNIEIFKIQRNKREFKLKLLLNNFRIYIASYESYLIELNNDNLNKVLTDYKMNDINFIIVFKNEYDEKIANKITELTNYFTNHIDAEISKIVFDPMFNTDNYWYYYYHKFINKNKKIIVNYYTDMLTNSFWNESKDILKLKDIENMNINITYNFNSQKFALIDIIPFFDLRRIQKNLSLVFNLLSIDSINMQSKEKFRINHFLHNFRAEKWNDNNSLFYFHYFMKNKKTKEKEERFDTTKGLLANSISYSLFPLVEIDSSVFNELFINKGTIQIDVFKEICKINEKIVKEKDKQKKLSLENDIDNIINKSIKSIINKDHNYLLLIKTIYKIAYILGSQEKNVIIYMLEKKPLFYSSLFISILTELFLESSEIKRSSFQISKYRRLWRTVFEKEISTDLENYESITYKYFRGVKEIVENIIYHTETDVKGYLYFRQIRNHNRTIKKGNFEKFNDILKLIDKLKFDNIVYSNTNNSNIRIKSFINDNLIENTYKNTPIYQDIISIFKDLKKNNFIDKENRIKNEILKTNDTTNYESRKYYLNNLSKEAITDFFIEICVYDFSGNGIKDTYNSKEKNTITKLESFLNPISLFKEHNPDIKKNHLLWRDLAHLGLKAFYNIVSKSNGYFELETNNSHKEKLAINSSLISQKKGEYRINKSFINGTQYNIILPVVKEITIKPGLIESKSMKDSFIDWLENEPPKIDITEIFSDTIKSYNIENSNQFELIKKIGKNILQINTHEYTIQSIRYRNLSKEGDILNFHKMIDLVFKILIFIQYENRTSIRNNSVKSYTIIYDLPREELEELITFFSIIKDRKPFWSNDNYLYIYDENMNPLIINGEEIEVSRDLNKKVMQYYGKSYWINENKTSEFGELPKNHQIHDKSIKPFELLLKTTNSEKPWFSEVISKIINNQYDNIKIKVRNAHIKLGSKIHLTNFYNAEELFYNSFFTERFAFFIVQDIIKKIKNNVNERIILLGYGEYSRLFVNNINSILRSYYNNIKIKKEILNFICNDVVNLKWDMTEKFTPRNNDNYCIIVPIGSTLSTIGKLWKSWEKLYSPDVIKQSKVIYATSTILIRDEIKENTSRIEEEYWTIDKEKNVSLHKKNRVANLPEKIYFYIEEAGQWSHPLECRKCTKVKDPKDEEILNITNKVSTIPRFIDSLPILSYHNQKKDFKKMKLLEGCIVQQHIERENKHFLYYTDTNLLAQKIKDNKKKDFVKKWLDDLKKTLNDYNDFHILISPLHSSNTTFQEFISNEIFSDTGIRLFFETSDDFEETIIQKKEYLKNYNNIIFHYIDDVIQTSSTFDKILKILNSLKKLFKNNDNKGKNISIGSAIFLINRMTKQDEEYLKEKLKIFFSSKDKIIHQFFRLNVPLIKNNRYCPLCVETQKFKLINEASVSPAIIEFNTKKINSLELKNYKTDITKIKYSNRAFNRLFLTEIIYNVIHEIETDFEEFNNEYEKNKATIDSNKVIKLWNKLLNKCEEVYKEVGYEFSILDKIDVVKIISSHKLSSYLTISRFSFKVLLLEIEELLNKKQYNLTNFNYLTILIKQLVNLNANYILRKEKIEKILVYYINSSTQIYPKIQKSTERFILEIKKVLKEKEQQKTILFQKEDNLFKKIDINDIEKDIIIIKNDLIIINKINQILNLSRNADFNKKNNQELITGKISKHNEKLLNFNKILLQNNVDTIKSVFNLIDFLPKFASYIKKLTFDETKSIVLENYLRTNSDTIEFPIFKNSFNFDKMINNIIKRNEIYKNEINNFLETIAIENNSVLNKAINNIVKEGSKNVCLFHNCNYKNVLMQRANVEKSYDTVECYQNICENFTSSLKLEDYFYDPLKKFIGDTPDKKYIKKIKIIIDLKVYLNSLICPSSENNSISLEDELKKITENIANLFSAKYAFIAINKMKNDIDNTLYVISNYNLQGKVNFKLFNKSETLRHFNGSDLFSIKSQINDLQNDSLQDIKMVVLIKFNNYGELVIGYKEKKDDIIDNLKFLFLIKNEIFSFFKVNFDNDNISNWIEMKYRAEIVISRFRKFKHGAGGHLRNLQETLKNENKILYSYSKFIETDVWIGEQFSNYINKIPFNFKESSYLYKDDFTKISENIQRALEYLKKSYADLSYSDNFEEYFLDNKYIISCFNKSVLEKMIFEIFANAIYRAHQNKTKFLITLTNNGIILKSINGRLIEDNHNSEMLMNFLEDEEYNPSIIKGIGLFTINKILNEAGLKIEILKVQRRDNEKNITNQKFELKIPINKEVDNG